MNVVSVSFVSFIYFSDASSNFLLLLFSGIRNIPRYNDDPSLDSHQLDLFNKLRNGKITQFRTEK